jgi:D-lactate dehydrogenase
LLNPGVILNPNPQAHISGLKQMPVVEAEVDKCIECGFCEHSCPSRDITLTPRQRIVVRREMQRLKESPDIAKGIEALTYRDLDRDFPYMALDTCAADGLCATDCPVSIDTGKLTKRFRAIRHAALTNRLAELAAGHFAQAEFSARLALKLGHLIEDNFGPRSMTAITQGIDRLSRKLLDAPFWQWTHPMPRARRGPIPVSSLTPEATEQADAVYYPACITRIMGTLPGEPDGISNTGAMLEIASRAQVKLFLPPDATGHCCGVPFSSKGFDAANGIAINRIIASFYRWSHEGKIPVVVDTSPCTYGLKTCRAQLSAVNQNKFDKLTILDSVEFAANRILPHLPITRTLASVALHPVCSATKMGLSPALVTLASACSEEVIVPQNAGCCAFAGDRGFLHPELTQSATAAEAQELESQHHQGYFSSSRTCEIGLTRATGKPYRSYLHMLEEASRP